MALEASSFSGRARLWSPELQCNSGQDGCTGTFWDASGSTRQPKYTPFRGAALRSLAARARNQTISGFKPLILLCAALTNFGGVASVGSAILWRLVRSACAQEILNGAAVEKELKQAVKPPVRRRRGANDPRRHQKQRLPKKIGRPGSACQRLCDAVECTVPGRHLGCPRRESISSHEPRIAMSKM